MKKIHTQNLILVDGDTMEHTGWLLDNCEVCDYPYTKEFHEGVGLFESDNEYHAIVGLTGECPMCGKLAVEVYSAEQMLEALETMEKSSQTPKKGKKHNKNSKLIQ